MTQSPTVPTGFPEAPVTPAELQAAQIGTAQRGGRIVSGLLLLAALMALGTLLGVWLNLKGVGWAQEMLTRVAALPDADPTWRDLTLPSWLAPSLAALTFLGGALAAWACLVASRFIASVHDYTLAPDSGSAELMAQNAHTIRSWLTLGQFAPLLNIVFSLLIMGGMLWFMNTSGLSKEADFPIGPAEIMTMLLSTVAQSLPSLIINWLILAAVKRWIEAVVTRSSNRLFPVRPFARKVDPWFILTMILLILGALSLLGGGLPMLALPALIPADALSDPELKKLGITPAFIKLLALGFAALLVGSGLLYALLTCLIAWSRGFAMNVATVLDASLPTPNVATGNDPWGGAHEIVPPRDPR